jgi:hypothetical protein
MTDKDLKQRLEADLYESLVTLGDVVAKRDKYRFHRGIDALHFYLVERYHWPLATVTALSVKELDFLCSELAEEIL